MSNQNNFKNIFIQKANELLMKREKRSFEMDLNNQYALEFFVSYFSDINTLEKLNGKVHKGLFIYGDYGTGKSLFFEILEQVYKSYSNPSLRIKTVNTIEFFVFSKKLKLFFLFMFFVIECLLLSGGFLPSPEFTVAEFFRDRKFRRFSTSEYF
jgi:hypothetical protein